MKYLLFVAILISQITITYAQAPRQRKPKTIELTPRLSQPHRFINPVSDIEVLMAHSDTNRLGFVQTSLINIPREALPDKPFQPYFQEYITNTYSPQYKADGNHLLLVIKYIRIGERTAQREKAFVRLKADAFTSADKSGYQLAGVIDTVLERSGIVDMTSSHNLNMETALDLLVAIADKSLLKSKVYLRDEVIKRELHMYDAPAYTCDTFTTGVYLSFQEFMLNAPAIKSFTPVVNSETAFLFANNEDGTQTTIRTPWGFCYNGQLYRFHMRGYLPFGRQGRAFIFTPFLRFRDLDNPAMGPDSGIYDMLGPFYKDRTVGKDPLGIRTFPYIHGLLPLATSIDPYTGEIMF